MRIGITLAIFARAIAQDATPTAESLLSKAIAIEKVQDAHGWKFTYREDEEKLPVDKNGKALPPSRRTYDNIMLENDFYRKLILIEGKPPDAKLQHKIDAEMERVRAVRRARPVETGRHEVRMGDLEQIARMCDSNVAGQEIIMGRMAWRVDSSPGSGYKPANKEEEKFLSARRVTWFDPQDGAAIKFLEVFLRPTAGFLPGTEIERGIGKHGDAWLNDSVELRYDSKLYGVIRGRGVARYRYYDYRRFEVDSRICRTLNIRHTGSYQRWCCPYRLQITVAAANAVIVCPKESCKGPRRSDRRLPRRYRQNYRSPELSWDGCAVQMPQDGLSPNLAVAVSE